MSSSRRSSPTSRVARHGACPTCGSRRVASVVDDVVMRVRGRKYAFEGVAHERCLACGERIFGIDASHMFDRVILKRRRAA